MNVKNIVNQNLHSNKLDKEKASFLLLEARFEAVEEEKKERKEMWERYCETFPENN